MHAFVCKYQEDCDLLLTIYDGEEMKAISENYVVKWGKQGVARDLDQFDNHRVLFTVKSMPNVLNDSPLTSQYTYSLLSFRI